MKVNIAQIFTSVMPGYVLSTMPARTENLSPVILEIPEGSLTTDYGNSFRFINEHRDNSRFNVELKVWLLWDGRRWEVDLCNRILRIGAETVRKILLEARASTLQDQKDLLTWSQTAQKPERINGMLKMAAPEMAVSWSQMDTDPMLLNVSNGTIDLRTGEIADHRPSHLNSKLAPVTYDPEAQCPRLISFLNSAFPGDPEMIHYMQKVFGYILTGDTKEKCFFIFYGPGGNNGKSVLINIIRHILGRDYAMQTPVDSLKVKKPGGNSNDLVRLKGARFVAASEIQAGTRYKFDEAQLKMLTGNDPVAARALFKEFIEYYPEFKLFIATNHMPEFNTDDTALMDRIMTIPFNVSFPREAEGRDEELLNQLKAEASGILNWAIQGCLLWQEEGLGAVPVRVELIATTNDRDAAIESFLQESCTFQADLTQKCGTLYSAYREWCLTHQIVPAGNGIVSRYIRDRHKLSQGTVGSLGVHWFGLSLKDDSSNAAAAIQH